MMNGKWFWPTQGMR